MRKTWNCDGSKDERSRTKSATMKVAMAKLLAFGRAKPSRCHGLRFCLFSYFKAVAIFNTPEGIIGIKPKEQGPLSGPAHCQRTSLKHRRMIVTWTSKVAVGEGFSVAIHLGVHGWALRVAQRGKL